MIDKLNFLVLVFVRSSGSLSRVVIQFDANDPDYQESYVNQFRELEAANFWHSKTVGYDQDTIVDIQPIDEILVCRATS